MNRALKVWQKAIRTCFKGKEKLKMSIQNEKVAALLEQLEVGLDTLFESDNYRKWLQTMSRFHSYSFGNTLLIARQCPDATRGATR